MTLPEEPSSSSTKRNISPSAEKDKSTASEPRITFPPVIEQVNYRVIVVPEPFTLDMGPPSDSVDQATEEVHLYLQPDADTIPFGWIHRLVSAKDTSFKSLRCIKTFVQSLEQRYISDLSESSWSRNEFLYLQELFETHEVKWEVFFRKLETNSNNLNSIDHRIFCEADTKQLLDVLRATVVQHY
jgi:hypothetical protein